MKMNRKWMILLLLILGAVITSGCSAPKDTVMMYNEAKEAFQKATIAAAKKCAPCQYATAEANLALADHEMKYYWREIEDLYLHSKIAKEKSLEALKLTPCEKPAPPAPTRTSATCTGATCTSATTTQTGANASTSTKTSGV